MNKETRDYIRNQRFFNRKITIKQAIVEGLCFSALAAAWVILCAVA